MKLISRPILNIEKVIAHYEKKDGVKIKYVCTTEIFQDDLEIDVFFRETPHPEFGNRYFGLYYNNVLRICNTDKIEELIFAMVNFRDEYYYSQSRHDFVKFGDKNEFFIDGGRGYYRVGGNPIPKVEMFKVLNGDFVKLDK